MSNNYNQTKRLKWPDFFKGLAITLVVFGHLGREISDTLLLVIYSFHIPIFFSVSGYLYNEDKGIQLSKLLFRVYVPLLVFSFFPIIFAKQLILGNFQWCIDNTLNTLFGWFLGTFVIATLLFRLLLKHCKSSINRLILSSVVMLGFIGIKDVNSLTNYAAVVTISLWLLTTGYLMKNFVQLVHSRALLMITSLLYLFLIGIGYYTNTKLSIASAIMSNIGVAVSLIFVNVYIVFQCANKLEKYLDNIFASIICTIGRYSIVIFITHGMIIDKLKLILPFSASSLWDSLLFTLITIVISCSVAFFSEKFCPILLGIRKK